MDQVQFEVSLFVYHETIKHVCCHTLFPIAVINTKTICKRKGLTWLTSHSPSLREVKARPWVQELKQRPWGTLLIGLFYLAQSAVFLTPFTTTDLEPADPQCDGPSYNK